jgi:molecular chaperone GrpE
VRRLASPTPYQRCLLSTTAENQTPENGSRPQTESEKQGPDLEAREQDDAQPDHVAVELAKKDSAIAELNDRALRALAEMENVRAIARRDVVHAREFGITAFARGLLVVADNLGLALNAVPDENLKKDMHLEALHTGVKATESELLKVFRQNGVEQFGSVGETFDPNRHDALYEAPSDTAKPGTIVDVAKVGYAIGDRVLRPAEVGVAKSAS